MQFDPWDLLNKAWIALAGVLAYFAKRHLDEDRKLAGRISLLEANHASRDDISMLHEKIDTNHRQVIDLLTRRV